MMSPTVAELVDGATRLPRDSIVRLGRQIDDFFVSELGVRTRSVAFLP